MLIARLFTGRVLLGFCLAGILALPLAAAEKQGMPDLAQEEQTCLPTSTANLIVWFGTHGYPKLIAPGDNRDDGYIHTVHRIMDATDASYQLGTRTEAITYGIAKYIHDAGYGCDVEYRGLDWTRKSSTIRWRTSTRIIKRRLSPSRRIGCRATTTPRRASSFCWLM
jgi:hypothetical protein